MQLLGGPTGGRWVQLALDDGTGIIGDIAVWLDADESLANVGYTLAPENQGRGYAVEAIEAIVEWLFRHQRVHRTAATIDPRNMASARVLERCGFRYEGTARSAAFVRHEWSDDARFSLARTRLAGTGSAVQPDLLATWSLVEITNDNVRAVGEIDRSFSQQELVAPVLVSLAEALVPPVVGGETIRPWLRAVEADDELVGIRDAGRTAGCSTSPVPVALPDRTAPSGPWDRAAGAARGRTSATATGLHPPPSQLCARCGRLTGTVLRTVGVRANRSDQPRRGGSTARSRRRCPTDAQSPTTRSRRSAS